VSEKLHEANFEMDKKNKKERLRRFCIIWQTHAELSWSKNFVP
jgi:hypothetical protein